MKKAMDYQMELLETVRSTLQELRKREHVQNIISDAIVFERVSTGMQKLFKAFNAESEEWEPSEYFGIYNAFPALGISTPPDLERERVYLSIANQLLKIFNDLVERDLKKLNKKEIPEQFKRTAEDLSKHILLEWEIFLNKVRFGKLQLN